MTSALDIAHVISVDILAEFYTTRMQAIQMEVG
jgi:hypothetical protein